MYGRYFKLQRVLGLAGTALVFYLIIFVVLGKTDVGWLLPTTKIANTVLKVWPDLPFFDVQKESINNGKDQETYYTVPTRTLTREEIAQLEKTNQVAQPATPSSITSPAR